MIATLEDVVVADDHGRSVLSRASLGVAEGEALALVGRNGSGKTTVLRLLGGLIAPTEGRVRLFGEDPARAGYAETQRLRTEVGLAFESFGLWAARTIGENIALPLFYHRGTSDIGALAKELGIEDALSALPSRVNASVKKRALLGRALVLSPRLLLCDEPQLGLVRREAKRVAEAIERRRQRGMTVIFADHDGELDPYVVTRRVYLEEGRVLDRPSMLPPSLRPVYDDDELPPGSMRAESVRGSLA